MGQRIKTLAAKPDDLSWNPWTHLKRENHSPELSANLPGSTMVLEPTQIPSIQAGQ